MEINLIVSREVDDLVSHLTIVHLTVWGLQEAVVIGSRIDCQGVNQTNVWTFRGLNWADTTIVCWVYVAHLKAGTLTGQTAWAKRRDTAFMRHLREWVHLIHKLRELARAEELFDCSRDRLGVDQLLRHQAIRLCQIQTLFHCTLNTHQTDTELVLGHLTDATDTTVTEVINIIH